MLNGDFMFLDIYLVHLLVLMIIYMHLFYLKHITTLFSLSDHDILSQERRVIVHQVETNYHDRPMVLESVRRCRTVDYEGFSLWSDVFQVS